MKFNPSDIICVPVHQQRGWDACNYVVNGIELFHERTYFPHNPFKQIHSEQWMPGVGTKAEIDELAAKYGGKSIEHFYAPEGANAWFLAFNDNDKAIGFCLTEEYDRLVLTEEKTL
jgi:hypothetical protein